MNHSEANHSCYNGTTDVSCNLGPEHGGNSLDTIAIHAGYNSSEDFVKGSVAPPIYTTTIYELSCQEGLIYTRLKNPNRDYLERKLAALEGAKYGAAFASGMGAVNALVTAVCKAGDNAIVAPNMYAGVIAYFGSVAPGQGIDVSWVDVSDPKVVKNSIRKNTKLVWIEALTNPLMDLVDVEAIAEAIREAAAENKTKPLLVVDNTFMTPFFLNPLKLGADVVLHSATKYMNGHSDALLGAVLCNDETLKGKLTWMQEVLGGIPSPFDCSMVFRGLRTFHLRMQRHMENAWLLAKHLDEHPRVSSVFHPGAKDYRFKELAEKQCRGFPGMLAFVMDGTVDDARRFLRSVKVAKSATSLGGTETLVFMPADVLGNTLKKAGVQAKWATFTNLVRVSVGLEDINDLIQDFDQALEAAYTSDAL